MLIIFCISKNNPYLCRNNVKKLQKDMIKGICYKIPGGYQIISWKNFTIPALLKDPKGRKAVIAKVEELKKQGKEILNTNII